MSKTLQAADREAMARKREELSHAARLKVLHQEIAKHQAHDKTRGFAYGALNHITKSLLEIMIGLLVDT